MKDLIGWNEEENISDVVTASRPVVLSAINWPPDYLSIYSWREKMLDSFSENPQNVEDAKAYYATRPKEFIMDWMDTFDPRREGSKWIPFVMFEKQAEFIDFLDDLRKDQENGLVEKSRDMGATWICCGYSIHSWLFIPDDAIGWGSRKQDLVDTLGDPDSIFEKMRKIIDRLPKCFVPKSYIPKKHATFMKLQNPENGAVITGEAGDNIGRGGRKSMYFKDEAAHYERPEKIEASLGDNTNVQVDISSVNGLGNVFHRRREQGVIYDRKNKPGKGYTRVFIMDWKDHPAKTPEWYELRKAKFEREGMAHIFAQEVDRNYSAAISNTVIPYEWIVASVDAHYRIPYLRKYCEEHSNDWGAGLDVADEGIDKNALTKRQSVIWRDCEEWGERDAGASARRAIVSCRRNAVHPLIRNLQYDSVGVGATVKAEYNRLTQDEQMDNIPKFVPWSAGARVLNPYERIIPDDDESPTNIDFYDNLKAQAWWSLRSRFYKTFKAVTENAIYRPEELISLDSQMVLLDQLMKELAQPTRGQSTRLKQIINKKPDGTKSPNLADAGVQMFFPVPDDYSEILVGNYG